MNEQEERILENLKDYEENPQEYSYQDWEDIFEDQDPFLFI